MVVRMADHAFWIFLFFLTLFEVLPHTKMAVQGNSHAFIHANSDVRYLVDGIPVPVHKELVGASSVRVPVLDENPIYNSKQHLKFDPPLLDFKERHLGMPHHEKVTLFNVNNNKTIHMSSISGNTVHFHSSFFEDKIIPPLGNTSFNVVFLGREEGEIESNLFIHTSEGSFKYHVKGASVSSPYRLRPLVGVRVPLNATYAPLISIHNPHMTPMQIVEVYSSGGEFHLELPSGELEGPKHLWEIPPFHTKPVIRIRFVARAEKNHTAYVRIKVNKSEEVLVVPLEVEVSSQPGLYSHDDIIDFGIGGSHDRPRKVKLALYNSLKKVIRIQNVITAPFSKAVRIDFQPLKVPPDSSSATQIATLTFDWHAAFESKQFSGKVIVKSKQNQYKLVIPYIAQVLEGGLEYNASVTQYCSEVAHLDTRNFTVRNSFKVPLALTNVSLQKEAEEYFNIEKFNSVTLNPGDAVVLFQLSVKKGNLPLKLMSNLLIYSNVSTVWVPLLCYNGRLSKVIVSEFNETELNFGTVGSASQREAHFQLFNYNPVPINIEDWGTNFTGAVVELLGVAEGNESTVKSHQNFSNMNMSTVLEPNWYAVLKVMVTAPDIEEELNGDVYIKTRYETIRIPVRMRVAHGRLEVLPDPLILDNCFPGKLCKQTLQVRSLFSRAMTVTSITSVPHDPRVSYWLANTSSEVIPLATSTIGEVMFDPASSCGNHCYLGVDTNSTAGSQWLQLLELPPHVHDIDLSLLSARYTSYVRLAGDKGFPVWQNISLQLHTTEVRRHMFWAKVMMTWPLLTLNVALSPGNTSVLTFPLTQIGNTTYKDLVIHNPSSKPLTLQLVMDWAYPVAERLLHDLPDGLTRCHECHNSPSREFTLEEGSLVGSYIEKLLGVLPHTNSLALVLQPGEVATTRLGFSPHKTGLSSAVLLIRNNLTILEIVRLSGRAAHAQFKFGNRKPGSEAPLMFELAEKHLKDCEREKNRKFPVPNLTVKRSFTARNTGDLNIFVSGFNINGLPCEGYGFRVLNCVPFQLPPNGTRKIDIAFTPDFTLARIQRSLSIETSLGISVNYSLITTLPPYFLASCSSVLGRPSWEPLLYYSAISFMTFILFCVLAAAFLESDRILKCAFVAVAKDKALRAASETKTSPNFQKNCDMKINCVKTEVLPDSTVNDTVSHHNEKRHRDCSNIKNVQNNICPKNCWSNFEERSVVETESKEKPAVIKFDDTEAGYSSNSTPLMSVKNKKKLSKKNSGNSEHSTPTDSIQENHSKKGWSCFLSRTTSSQQNKTKVGVIDNKATSKNTQEIEISNKKVLENPKENKRANQSHKKCVRTVSEPVICSEEETSSTTTESSNNDEIEKERENLNSNRENKAALKKDKEKEMDYKDNYEGDCDDDEYEQEGQKKKDYGNHWKPNTKSSCNKTMSETPVKVTNSEVSKSASLELPYKLKTSKPVSRERKEKNVLKKRTSEKNGALKTSGPVSGSGNSSSSSSSASCTVRVSPPLRTSGSCWGEHRASFSDVVARSDSTLYSSIVAPRKRQQPSSPTSLPTVFSENNTRIKSSEVIPMPVSSSSGLGPIGSKKPSSSTWDLSESQQSLPPFLQQPQEQSSLFVDALTEPTPITTEEEKSSALPYGGDAMWEQGNSIVPLLEENNRKTSVEFRRQDLFRENWPGVDSLWEPLYTPAVDNSQLFTPNLRNEDIRGTGSVWGSLIGSVWSSSTWSNGPGPVAPPLSSGQTPILSGSGSSSTSTSAPTTTREDGNGPEENTSEIDQGLGFDPFRSLNTIWFPSSPDSWNPAGSK
ncbi:hypothetical protein R5R35_013787 [Gryllus longicercus]|uniref:Transmembrane protein 131 n=1 Tax=Gryllus longicercus TaxID=2509291 RepID=A0AAN9VYZ1_9ORTH